MNQHAVRISLATMASGLPTHADATHPVPVVELALEALHSDVTRRVLLPNNTQCDNYGAGTGIVACQRLSLVDGSSAEAMCVTWLPTDPLRENCALLESVSCLATHMCFTKGQNLRVRFFTHAPQRSMCGRWWTTESRCSRWRLRRRPCSPLTKLHWKHYSAAPVATMGVSAFSTAVCAPNHHHCSQRNASGEGYVYTVGLADVCRSAKLLHYCTRLYAYCTALDAPEQLQPRRVGMISRI